MNWLRDNWKRVAKWSGLGAGCLVVAFSGFVLARYVASGSEFEGGLIELAPADVAVVMTIDNVPNRKGEFERFLDELLRQPGLPQLERSSLWRDSAGKMFGDSLERFRNETYEQGLKEARGSADEMGIELFRDVMGGEMVICTDPGESDGGMLMLTRLERGARFKWQFLDVASGFFPEGPNQPRLEFAGGVLKVTPPAKPGEAAPSTILVTLLDDVLVVSDSARLLNGAIARHAGEGKGIAADKAYQQSLALVEPSLRERHFSGVWMNLDRLRQRLPAETDEEGREVSPVDAFNSLPASVVAIYPDIFGPVNRIVSQDLDTRPFRAAYYGLDITEPGVVSFDQYLLVDEERMADPAFAHLRETWKQPAAEMSQLALLPPDTMLQVSYRQPLGVLYNDVLDDAARGSLVGDFVVALNGDAVKQFMPRQAEELVFAAVPRSYAPGAAIPVSGTDMPLPGFTIAFRTPGADPVIARALLDEYLQVQRGRGSKPGEPPKKGAVSVVQKTIAGRTVFGFDDPREEDNFIRRLNLSIHAALVGDWLLLTNSAKLLEHAILASEGRAPGLAQAPGSAWRSLPTSSSATIYLNFEQFVNYAASPELFKVLRDNKYNPTLIEGRDPREIREEIVRELGMNPADTMNLSRPEVEAAYQKRKAAWQQKCELEGGSYQAKLQADMNGLRFFKDLALTTRFQPDHLYVHGILRLGQ